MSTNSPPASHAVEIVSASLDDLDALLPLIREYYAFDDIAFDEGAIRRGLHHLLGDEKLGGAWFIRRGGDAVGFFVLTFGFDLELGGHLATVNELYLRPEARRSGLGTEALRFIEEHLSSMGIFAYELHVEQDNTAARAFYAKQGFHAHDRIPLSKRITPRDDANVSFTPHP